MPDLADVYRAQARPGGSEHWSGPPQMVERIARTLGTAPTDLVVDVGCGVGGPAWRLAELVGCRVIGVDVVRDVVRSGTRRFGRRVRFVGGAAEALPLRSGIADQLWSLGTAAHVLEQARMGTEVARVLRSGGSLAITEAFWEGR